jgi:hypothetical protein
MKYSSSLFASVSICVYLWSESLQLDKTYISYYIIMTNIIFTRFLPIRLSNQKKVFTLGQAISADTQAVLAGLRTCGAPTVS